MRKFKGTLVVKRISMKMKDLLETAGYTVIIRGGGK